MVKCGNSQKSTHPPLWQTCKVLRPWALFCETTVHTTVDCEFDYVNNSLSLSVGILIMLILPTRHTHDCAFAPFSSIQQHNSKHPVWSLNGRASCTNSTIFVCFEAGDNQYQLIPMPRLSAIVFMCILI